jgi:hypothetical protein
VGLCEHQIERCQAELQKLAEHGETPMLFPAIWLDVFIETRVRRAAARTDSICHIQKNTGLHWSVNNRDEGGQKIDFEEVIYALTVLGSELAWDEFAISVLAKIQEKVLAGHKHIFKRSRSSPLSDIDQIKRKYADVVAMRLIHSKDILCGLKGRVKLNAEQVKWQNQAVRYDKLSN